MGLGSLFAGYATLSFVSPSLFTLSRCAPQLAHAPHGQVQEHQPHIWHPPVVRRRPAHLSTGRLGVRAKVVERRADRVWERGGVPDGVEYASLSVRVRVTGR